MHNQSTAQQLRTRLDLLADDVGRLRRRRDADSSAAHLGDRIAGHVHCLYGFVVPTAAELVAWHAPAQNDAIQAALEHVDHLDRQLVARLGGGRF